jgi:hypothetical protein
MFCRAGEALRIAQSLPVEGAAKVLDIDTAGAHLL